MLIPTKDIAFTKDQVDKIGNTIIYLSKNITDLNKTKILKILFLLEEASIKKYAFPFFGIDFQIWRLGPVVKDIFIDLSEETPTLLSSYIKRKDDNSIVFEAAADFNDDQFSDNDMDILKIICTFSKNKTASDLIYYTHNHNSLWRKSAMQNNVLELLENGFTNSTEYNIDFSLLFQNNPELLQYFEEVKENLEFTRHLKS